MLREHSPIYGVILVMGVMPVKGPCMRITCITFYLTLYGRRGNDRESKSNEIDYKTVFFVFLVAFKEGRLYM